MEPQENAGPAGHGGGLGPVPKAERPGGPRVSPALQSGTRASVDPALPLAALPRLRLVARVGALAFSDPHLGAAGRGPGARGRMPPGSIAVP